MYMYLCMWVWVGGCGGGGKGHKCVRSTKPKLIHAKACQVHLVLQLKYRISLNNRLPEGGSVICFRYHSKRMEAPR